ncbi:hypothetical protein NX784_24945 [Massilia pinisoli]|uniref:Uncharacterized protein n=1 Tax=Massilia pinisoli TaxID=1772194 RepID=A0ABT1ZYY5_9BURK|nr:hypothetical protein [Massilia pinisoli]MCS0584839.1 hypothetical protein [Massilia pinisoli]
MTPMTYQDSLRLLVWDKAALALVGILFGGLLTHILNMCSKSRDRHLLAIDDSARRKREASLRIIDGQIDLLQRRLDEFLWPLTLYLMIDGAVWKKVPGLHVSAENMPTEAGRLVESQCLLPNHYRAVELIEKNFHLVAGEDELRGPMIDYVQHVAIFRALREANLTLNPIDVDEPPRLLWRSVSVSQAGIALKCLRRSLKWA